MDYNEHLDRAGSVGVMGVIQVGTDVETSRWSAALAHREPRVLAAVAIHPNEAPLLHQAGELDDALAVIDELAAMPRVVAVGETGLDFFRTPEDLQGAQKDAFRAHIEIAKKHGIALQIHDRDAHDQVVEVLLEVGAPEKTVFHCFSGDAELAEVLSAEGWYASFAGTVTFKNSEGLREALKVMPRSQILVETDTPFLTPVPSRGKPNSPYMIPFTVRSMAETLEMDENLLAAQLTDNTIDVYGRFDDQPLGELGSVLRGR
jgi:TatD DNase family protein